MLQQLILVNKIAVWRITILLVWVLGAHDGASAKHHLVLSEGASLVWEDVFDLSQVLCDVQGLTLDATVCLLIVQINVIRDEEDLTNLHQLNGHVEGDGNQDLKGRRENGNMEKRDRNEVTREGKGKEVMGVRRGMMEKIERREESG